MQNNKSNIIEFFKENGNPSFVGAFELDENLAKSKGLRYKSWGNIAPHWYANTGISRPYLEFIIKPKETYKNLISGNAFERHQIYENKTRNCFQTIRDIFKEPGAQIAFESNGTAMLALIRAIAGAEGLPVLMTTDMGRITTRALRGDDTSLLLENFKQPVSLFAPSGKLNTVISSPIYEVDLYKDLCPKKSDVICQEIFDYIQNIRPKMVVIPQVSRTGIPLPVEKIGIFIKDFNLKNKTNIVYVVDAAQSVGRVGSLDIQNPLRYCDFYFFVGQKALGSMIIATVLFDHKILEKNVAIIINSTIAPRLCHYQFSDPPADLLNFLRNNSSNAISLPEVESLDLALKSFFRRGDGPDFYTRRNNQKHKMAEINFMLAQRLNTIQGIEIVENRTPGIITFTIDSTKSNIDAFQLRHLLQKLDRPITLAPMYQKPLLRIGLSELQKHNFDYLIHSIKKIVN